MNLDRVDKTAPAPAHRPELGNCWTWQGSLVDGYGQVSVRGRPRRAHIVSWEVANGRPVPAGLQVDHLCMVRSCINPAHLEVVTQKENIRRMQAFYGIGHARTHCPRGHEYTDENTYARPGFNERRCRECHRQEARLYKRKKREEAKCRDTRSART